MDDYSFLPYIFGSAQLLHSSDPAFTLPSCILASPNSGKAKSLPETNMYFMNINRINRVKTGPFHEHSSQLYNIAMGVKGWKKVHSGLMKMYEAEVLGKRVVVQHIQMGGLLDWNTEEGALRFRSCEVQSTSPQITT